MLADTASRSWDCFPGSIWAGSKCPKDRVHGSRTSMRTGGRTGHGGTVCVSYPYRARGTGASMSAQRATPSPAPRQPCGTPVGRSP